MLAEILILISRFREKLVKKALPFLMIVTFFFVCASSIVMYFLERNANPNMRSYLDSLWWCLVTITTVGYGDVFPMTGAGKVLAAVTMTFGIGFIGMFTATIATVLLDSLLKEGKGLGASFWKNHIVICNWNCNGYFVVEELLHEKAGTKSLVVLLANLDEKPVDEDIVFLKGNPFSEEDLKRANIEFAKAVIILAEETRGVEKGDADARSVLATLAVRSLNKRARIVAEVLDHRNMAHFMWAGADEVINTSRLMGNLLARSALHYGMGNVVSDLLTSNYGNQIYKLDIEPGYVGMKYEEALTRIMEKASAVLIAVESDGAVITRPAGHVLKESDKLFLIAKTMPLLK